jgi:protein-tyrosine phosphatase
MPRLEGAPNFRDVSALTTACGGRVRAGRLFRSDSLHAISDADLDTLARLDIRLVCDLRGKRERVAFPDRWPKGAEMRHLEFGAARDASSSGRRMYEATLAEMTPKCARTMMIENYKRFPFFLEQPLRALFAMLGSETAIDDSCVLVHCAAGKDRTGFVIAMLLSALRVPRSEILDEYMQTKEQVSFERRIEDARVFFARLAGVVPEEDVLAEIASVDVEFLDAAFSSIENVFGNVERYLESACGLNRQVRDRYFAAMTEL